MKKNVAIQTVIKYPLLFGAGFAVAVVLLYHLAIGAYSAIFMTERPLTVHDFSHVGIETVDDYTVITTTEDSQLHLEGNVFNLYVDCTFSYDPGEFVAFYQNNLEKGFSPEKLLYARVEGDYYVFEFPLDTKKIRLDIGVFPSITTEFEEITLNKNNLVTLLRLSPSSLFALLVLTCIFTSLLMFAPQIKKHDRKTTGKKTQKN